MFKNIISIVLIGIAMAVFFTFTNPMYKNFVAEKAQIASYNEALNNSKMLENERDKLTKKFNSIDPSNLERLQKFLPDSIDNIRLILEMEKLALPYGMILKDVKYATLEKSATSNIVPAGMAATIATQDYGTWDLEFSTQGTYSNFISFIKEIENNLRMVDIVSVDFSSDVGLSPGAGSSEAYKYNIKIKTYWLKN